MFFGGSTYGSLPLGGLRRTGVQVVASASLPFSVHVTAARAAVTSEDARVNVGQSRTLSTSYAVPGVARTATVPADMRQTTGVLNRGLIDVGMPVGRTPGALPADVSQTIGQARGMVADARIQTAAARSMATAWSGETFARILVLPVDFNQAQVRTWSAQVEASTIIGGVKSLAVEIGRLLGQNAQALAEWQSHVVYSEALLPVEVRQTIGWSAIGQSEWNPWGVFARSIEFQVEARRPAGVSAGLALDAGISVLREAVEAIDARATIAGGPALCVVFASAAGGTVSIPVSVLASVSGVLEAAVAWGLALGLSVVFPGDARRDVQSDSLIPVEALAVGRYQAHETSLPVEVRAPLTVGSQIGLPLLSGVARDMRGVIDHGGKTPRFIHTPEVEIEVE